MRKTGPKNNSYSKNETILKVAESGYPAKAVVFAKSSLWVKIKNAKKHAKNVFTGYPTCFIKKKTVRKNS